MADYLIGLDFGTSQTKVCVLNKSSDIREFVKFENQSYFLPSLIVKKPNNTFSYGDENESGIKYRYFKMAAAEDEDLIQVTNEDLNGHLIGNTDDYRNYQTNYDIKPEILVVLYLAYTYLFIKQQKSTYSIQNLGSLLNKFTGKNNASQNTFSINLGIPTEWNNPNHIKRKIKFQSLLISSIELASQFENLKDFLDKKEKELITRIAKINQSHLLKLNGKSENEKSELIKILLRKHKLSVFPESAAGVNYLLKTRRLANGFYATLDVGAGTSDIAIFRVNNNILAAYYCSESIEIASNDVYREYAKQFYNIDSVSFEEIKTVEINIRNKKLINDDLLYKAVNKVRGLLDISKKGLDFAIRKTFHRKYFENLHQINKLKSFRVVNDLNECLIIVYGGGANIKGFCSGNYCFYLGYDGAGIHDKNFAPKPITDFVSQVDIIDDNADINEYINLLILSLGLTYKGIDDDFIPFVIPESNLPILPTPNFDRYFYYDLQDAVYK